jgi:hypothetical protein
MVGKREANEIGALTILPCSQALKPGHSIGTRRHGTCRRCEIRSFVRRRCRKARDHPLNRTGLPSWSDVSEREEASVDKRKDCNCRQRAKNQHSEHGPPKKATSSFYRRTDDMTRVPYALWESFGDPRRRSTVASEKPAERSLFS